MTSPEAGPSQATQDDSDGGDHVDDVPLDNLPGEERSAAKLVCVFILSYCSILTDVYHRLPSQLG